MLDSVNIWLRRIVSTNSVGAILIYGFFIRILLVIYSIYHDSRVDHIKYTDIDYTVFTNGSRALVEHRSPYDDIEYRYSPLVALTFAPNILFKCDCYGKLLLVVVDIICGQLNYRLNIYQGTNRLNARLFLLLWLFNPVTIAISTRGSFEPILALLLLTCIFLLVNNQFLLAGLIFGLSIHIKLYPIIYSIPFYGYMIQKRPYLITQSKLNYWLKTFSPTPSQYKFFISTTISLLTTCYLSYLCYGHEYIEQSFIYHIRRKDLQHNFSIYFYLFKLFPNYRDGLSAFAFVVQFIGVIYISLKSLTLDTNRRVKLRKLTFSLFAITFLFVSLNKVVTSQYFIWYLTFLPLIQDSLGISANHACTIVAAWLLSQANWLFFAYLYEFQHFDVLDLVGSSSVLFLMCNLWILSTLYKNFDTSIKSRDTLKES